MAARIEIALDIEGLGLRIGGVEDFIRLPVAGDSRYFYSGQRYDVLNVTETIGDPTSLSGSVLFDLLADMYGSEKAERLLAESKRIGGTPPALVRPGSSERLIYVKLKPVAGTALGL